MTGLLVLAVMLVWAVVCVWIALRVSRWAKRGWLRAVMFIVLLPAMYVAPLADEIIGNYQFERYCREANQVHIYGTIPVGEELYFPDGKWRLSARALSRTGQETKRIEDAIKTLIRYEFSGPKKVPAIIPIREYYTRKFDRQEGRLLAEYRHYATGGGWLSQNFEKPLIVRDQCFPDGRAKSTSTILPFDPALKGLSSERANP